MLARAELQARPLHERFLIDSAARAIVGTSGSCGIAFWSSASHVSSTDCAGTRTGGYELCPFVMPIAAAQKAAGARAAFVAPARALRADCT